MTKPLAVFISVLLLAAAALPALSGTAASRPQMVLRNFAVEGDSLQGALHGGPWEWSGNVTATGLGLTLTCDTFKVWLTPDAREAERIEASGHIRVSGRYLAANKNEWDVKGQANSATYDRKADQAVLQGAVDFQAKNLTTGAQVSAAAEKMTYDTQTERFRFERGAEPVRMEWKEPPQPASESAPSTAKETTAQQ